VYVFEAGGSMRGRQAVLVGALILLFFGLSFNAYACLLPVNGVMAAAMGNGCSTPDERPVSQFCDTFKTLSVQSASDLPSPIDSQTFGSEDTALLSVLLNLPSHSSRLCEHPADGLPQTLFLKTSVLRL
jgi:hypothetical protein